MEVELQEHRKDNEPGDIKRLKPQQGKTLKAKIPLPEYGSPFDHKTKRTKETRIQFWQFPLNISNARTVHKLQGRSIDNLVVSSFFIDTHIVLCCAVKSEGNQRVASYVRIE